MSLSQQGILEGVWCTRGGVVESVHQVHAVVATSSGRVVAGVGSPDWMTVYRSAAKPFQAIPLVTDGVVDRFGLDTEELALAAASHNGEPEHVSVAERILRKVGLPVEALKLGPHPPLRPEAAESLFRSGGALTPLHNNCSGQHAAMLGLALVNGWPVETYLEERHPLQARMMEEMVRFTGVRKEEIRTMQDGCGMVAFGVPLRNMARSFALLGEASREEEGPARILEAMGSHPHMVGGTGRICTALGRATRGRIIGKLGAEGVYGITIPSEGLGVALKIQDGGIRAGDAATVRVLDLLGVLDTEEAQALEVFRRCPVHNTLGERVGEIFANFTLEP